MSKYILNEKGEPVKEDDVFKWAEWFENADRKVAIDHVGKTMVSTVFLGLDHSFGGDLPLLFETMTYTDGTWGPEQERYSTKAEALEGHRVLVQSLKIQLLSDSQ